MSAVVIRLFGPEDTESLASLCHEMSVHYNGENASTLDRVRSHLISTVLGSDSDVRIVVASDGAEVIGMAAIAILYPAPKEKGQLFMKELYVRSARRGDGIGERMMRWVAKYAVEHGCSRFDWVVDAPNIRAVDFYDALGAAHVKDKLYYRLDGRPLQTLADAWSEHDA